MVLIINNKIDPPGFLKPLAVETGESSKEKVPEEIIVLSDIEEENKIEYPIVEKPLPLVSVKKKHVDPVDDLPSDISAQNVNSSISVDPNSAPRNPQEKQVADEDDGGNNIPLSQIRKSKEKAKGKTKVTEGEADTNLVRIAARWDFVDKSKIFSERFLGVEKFKSQCQLLPVFEKIQLMRSVTNLKDYPPIAIKEFYANLMPTIKQAGSTQYGRVWLRGKSYTFTSTTTNMYFGIDADDIDDPVMGANTITKIITGGTYSYWPTETNMLPAKSLTTKHAILHKIAMNNWMPSEHRGALNLQMANLIYRIGKGIPVDLGDLISNK
ncbi:uncharacterized protein LOC115995986 [Ipomoea triloba]|uniref:uncharacterized protein LOC115995986 n=1 Tax=Ipomoea triloba TaxID=35885 RepID=UPI00125CEB58|nr:uncharacterized protein LOC115995986 [Ipomoea triloba]